MDKIEYMKEALKEAHKAYEINEVPIGAIIVYNGEIVGKGYNMREAQQLTISHAEINAIKDANNNIGSWKLDDCEMYVTVEPCSMCAGAIQQSRIKKVYYGTKDLKAGALGTIYNMYFIQGLNHYPLVEGGILEDECAALLKDFFVKLRNK